MIEKMKVKNNFSKNVSTYNEHAVVQKKMGEELAGYIGVKEPEKILEIGCGTGIFSKMLTEKYPKSDFVFLDISPEMIEEAKKNIIHKNSMYIVGDAEEIEFDRKFSLITSNAVFQWFQDVKSTGLKYLNFLNQGGELVFSTFGENTFYELADSFKRAGESYNYSQKFSNVNELRNIAEISGTRFEAYEKFYVEEYDSLIDFLYAIKRIGASSGIKNQKNITRTILKDVEKFYFNNFSEKGKIRATNHILFIKIKKEK